MRSPQHDQIFLGNPRPVPRSVRLSVVSVRPIPTHRLVSFVLWVSVASHARLTWSERLGRRDSSVVS